LAKPSAFIVPFFQARDFKDLGVQCSVSQTMQSPNYWFSWQEATT
jgi:hypothetical protein